jgi:Ca-activated chloride channel family protein
MNHLDFAGFGLDLFGLVDLTIPALAIFAAGLLTIAVMLWFHFRRKRFRSATLRYSDIRIVKRAARSNRQKYRFILTVLRTLVVALLVVAFARPRAGTEVKDVTSEGIDIMMILDVSSSMLAEDFKPNNRLYVAKEELKKFVQKRISDRIGLVVFARYAYTQCPLTLDYGVLLNFVDQVQMGVVDDGTAIGMAIATAANRLRESSAKSKVMVLLTDGDNNAGEIDPPTAASIAAAYDIKIYTIAAGRPGNAMYPVQDPIFGKRYVYQPTRVDEESLKQIAERTGGKYFRARSGEELDEIYSTIDKLEKTEIKVAAHIEYRELFQYFMYAALALLALEILLTNTLFRKLP